MQYNVEINEAEKCFYIKVYLAASNDVGISGALHLFRLQFIVYKSIMSVHPKAFRNIISKSFRKIACITMHDLTLSEENLVNLSQWCYT